MQEIIRKWSEDKIMLLQNYAKPFSQIVKKKLKAVYIDAFAGIGEFVSERNGQIVPGSPKAILEVKPAFNEYYFIEQDPQKLSYLKELAKQNDKIIVKGGDCNNILLNEVFPNVRYKDYKRALCFLDPYGIHLDWSVIEQAGSLKTIEIFLNFSIMHINRNVLRHNPSKILEQEKVRMNKFWGSSDWMDLINRKESVVQVDLFGNDCEQVVYSDIVNAYTTRLKTVAKFKYVSTPVPMRNSKGNIIYFLIHATHNDKGADVVRYIFNKYLKTRGSNG